VAPLLGRCHLEWTVARARRERSPADASPQTAPRLAEDLFRDYSCSTAATPLTAVLARRLHYPLWCCISQAKGRADERTRTADLLITSELLLLDDSLLHST
jgi:hypothetical protein